MAQRLGQPTDKTPFFWGFTDEILFDLTTQTVDSLEGETLQIIELLYTYFGTIALSSPTHFKQEHCQNGKIAIPLNYF